MIMTTLDQNLETEANMLGDTRRFFGLLRKDIEELREQIASGEDAGTAEAAKKINALDNLYGIILKSESRIATLEQTKLGIAQNGVAFDLHAARDAIGSKLDSLRGLVD